MQVKCRYLRNENICSTNLLLAAFGFNEIKVKHSYHSNENIPFGNLLFGHFGFNEI